MRTCFAGKGVVAGPRFRGETAALPRRDEPEEWKWLRRGVSDAEFCAEAIVAPIVRAEHELLQIAPLAIILRRTVDSRLSQLRLTMHGAGVGRYAGFPGGSA